MFSALLSLASHFTFLDLKVNPAHTPDPKLFQIRIANGGASNKGASQ